MDAINNDWIADKFKNDPQWDVFKCLHHGIFTKPVIDPEKNICEICGETAEPYVEPNNNN